MEVEVNQYQTPITEELLAMYPDEVVEQFMDCITNIPFIKWMISPDRPKASQLPRDGEGRIIVDLEHPHIIEDADYFRLPALHFLKHGCYTFLRPNSNPNSEYRRYWDEEVRRCREGYVRQSDGEWVTGFCYWFLNYNPMMVNFITEGKKKAVRKESFPFFFEGIYLRFHYLWQAREAGKHAIELAKRGAHPYDEKVFTPEGWKVWGDIMVGSKLFDTSGNETTVVNITSNGLMPVYRITLRDGRTVRCSDDHKWVVQIHNHKWVELLTTKELLEVYKKERSKSVRIPSGIEYTTKIPKNNGVTLNYSPTKVDPYTFGLLLGDGCFRHRSCYYTLLPTDLEIELQYIPYNIIKWQGKYAYRIAIPNWRTILKEYGLIDKKSEDKFIPDEYKYNSKEVRLNLLKGLMDSDGSIHGGVPNISTTSQLLRDDIMEVGRSLGYNCSYVTKKTAYNTFEGFKECLPSYDISIYAGKEIFNLLRKQEKVHYDSTNALSRANGTIITNIEYLGEEFCKCVEVDSKDSCYLIGDFITTHNCGKSYSLSAIMTHNLELGESEESKKRITTVLTAYQKEYLKDDKDGTFSKFRPALSFILTNTPFPRLMLKSSPNEMSWLMGYKDEFNRDQGSFNTVLGVSAKDDADKLRGKRGWILFEEMGCHLKGTEVLMYDCTLKKVEDIVEGDLLMGRDGAARKVLRCFSGSDTMYKISLSNGDWHIVNSKHPIYYKRHKWYKGTTEECLSTAPELLNASLQGYYIPKASIEFPHREVLLNPYTLGLWLGDGNSYNFSIANKDREVLNWLQKTYSEGYIQDLKQSSTCKVFYVPAHNKHLYDLFNHYDLFRNKHIPTDYIYNSKEIQAQVLAGLIDTDGNLSIKAHSACFEITLRYDRKQILDAAKFMATNLGLRCTMSTRIGSGKKPGVIHYRLKISGDLSIIPTKILRKQYHTLSSKYRQRLNWSDYTFSISEYGLGEYYGFEVDKDHLFVLKDSTITHNTFAGLLALYDTTRKSVEDGDYTFATMYLIGCVCAGTKVWLPTGEYINIEDLKQEKGIIGFTDTFNTTIEDGTAITLLRGITREPINNEITIALKACVEITLSNGNKLRCSTDHPILTLKLRMNHNGSIRYYEEVFKEAGQLKIGDRVLEARKVPIFGNVTLFDARLVGMLIGDGTYGSSVRYCSEDAELIDYIEKKYTFKETARHITKKGNIYKEGRINGIRHLLANIGILGQTKLNKRLPFNYLQLDEKNVKLLLSGLYDTDGSIYLGKDGRLSLTQCNKEILELVQILWRKFGVVGTIIKTLPTIREDRKDRNSWYTLVISGRYNCLEACKILNLLVSHKATTLKAIEQYYLKHSSKKEQKYPKDVLMYKVVSIRSIGNQEVYNLTAGLSHTYLANNIITHNTANDAESDFSSAKKLLLAPDAYNILSLENVFDKVKQGSRRFGFFFPCYINRAGCYNKDGVSDVVKALLEVLSARYKAKYNSADPTSILRVIAEDPITPVEAIVKVKAAYFPVVALNERLNFIDTHPRFYDDTWVGTLIQTNGVVEFKPTEDIPIRLYGVSNDTIGALEIYQMPEKKPNGEVFENRYIIGHDPVDNDLADSSSLSSTIVFDLFTDQIVAEFTGRKPMADDNFEMVRLLCLFYNATCLYESNKKGLYAYMKSHNSAHLLADTPQYLRDKQLVKYSAYGSNAKGVNASAPINNYANDLIRLWLLKPRPIVTKDDEGNDIESEEQTLYTLKNRALIEELVAFNPEINVDRIRALGMVMLYRLEKLILYLNSINKEDRERIEADYLGKDDFFSRNYDRKLSFRMTGSKFSKIPNY